MTRDRGDRPVKGTGRIGSPGSADRSSQSLARSLARAFKTVDPRPTSIDSSSGNETGMDWRMGLNRLRLFFSRFSFLFWRTTTPDSGERKGEFVSGAAAMWLASRCRGSVVG